MVRATVAPLVLATLVACVVGKHTEELYVRPLPHAGSALAHFHFATEEPVSATPSTSLYPNVIRQILTKFDVNSIHLSFMVGQYSEARYGPPSAIAQDPHDQLLDAPFGARLQVAFNGDEGRSGAFLDRWRGVTSELGGLFSASLNQMDETTLARIPDGKAVHEFGLYDSRSTNTSVANFFQSTLAREELCTENLTPWLKMLPCRSHAGLGTVIDPITILSGEYAMLSVFASRGDGEKIWRFHQHLTTVQRVEDFKAWSLDSLLLDSSSKARVEKVVACPVASASNILFEGSSSSNLDLKLNTDGVSTSQVWALDSSPSERPHNVVSVHRFQTGHGQVHGGFAVRFENNHASCASHVTYNDISPWFLRLYFHTFQSRFDSLDGNQKDTVAPTLSFTPAELRGQPNRFRVEFDLPPKTALTLSIQFDKVFIRLSEHPPDANRGFDIPSGVAQFSSGSCSVGVSRTVYTEPLLVALPTPDFSMPYNVITLTSTVVAFFVGSMLNTLLRKAPRIKRMLADDTKKTNNP